MQALTLKPNVLKVLTSTNSSSPIIAHQSAKIVICVMEVLLYPFVSIVSKALVNVQNFAIKAKRNAVPVMKLLDYVIKKIWEKWNNENRQKAITRHTLSCTMHPKMIYQNF